MAIYILLVPWVSFSCLWLLAHVLSRFTFYLSALFPYTMEVYREHGLKKAFVNSVQFNTNKKKKKR